MVEQKAVDDAAGAAAGEGAGQPRLASVPSARRCGLGRSRLGREQERRADCRRGGAGGERCGDIGCARDAAGGDERQPGRASAPSRARRGAVGIVVVVVERALMPAGLGSLDDERVHPRGGRVPGLGCST